MYEIKVQGMTCGGCVNAISKAVKTVDVRAAVDASIPDQVVKVESNVEINVIKRAIEGAGFQVLGTAEPAH
ncbi:MAG: hypothetical protein RIR26_391 [Pseudomonadota bacterium]|jgi:copper chaperone